jgi:hypothetical protein
MARNTKLVSDASLLEAALEGLELQRQRVQEQIQQVRALLGKRRPSQATTEAAPARKRQLSSAARKRIAAAQKKRWAEYRKSTKEE